MKKRNLLLAALLLLVVGVVGTTIAYFTDTDEKTNTFTIGNVDIELKEENWDADNAKNLMPGDKVAKDPVIENKSTTNPAYVFAKVVAPCVSGRPIFKYTVASGWTEMTAQTVACNADGLTTKIYAYGSATAMTPLTAGASTPALFSEVEVENLTNAEATTIGSANLNIIVTGYGIQTKNVGTDPTTVWGNFGS